MLRTERWAAVFLGICADQKAKDSGAAAAQDALEILKTLAPLIRAMPDRVSGLGAALKLDAMLRRSQALLGLGGSGWDYARRFAFILVQHGLIHSLPELLPCIAEKLDAQRSLCRVILQSPFPVDSAYVETLKNALVEKLGIQDIVLDIQAMPELLGGYRLLIGNTIWDGSTRKDLRQLEGMLKSSGGSV